MEVNIPYMDPMGCLYSGYMNLANLEQLARSLMFFVDRSGSCRELRSALQQVAAWDRNMMKTEIQGQKWAVRNFWKKTRVDNLAVNNL